MVITKREDVTKQGFCKTLLKKLRLPGSLKSVLTSFWGGNRKGVGTYLSLSVSGREVGWGGGGCSFEAGQRLTFSAFRMGAYLRWVLIRGWVLIRINTVLPPYGSSLQELK